VSDGLNVTTGNNVLGGGVNFFFGQNVDGANLFFVDLASVDPVTVNPIDGAGSLIGDFELSIVDSGGGVAGGFDTLAASLNGSFLADLVLRGVVFNTSDFSGTGALTGVEGIRLTGAGFDTMVVGIAAVIPEPSSLALLFIGVSGVALRRRRVC